MAATILNLDSELSRKGARACLQALRGMEAAEKCVAKGPQWTWENHWQYQQTAFDNLLRASGADTPFLRGFVAALAEYAESTMRSGEPNLDVGGWTPLATMTDTEASASRHHAEECTERFERELVR